MSRCTSFDMKIPLAVLLVSCIWQCVISTTTTDGTPQDGTCLRWYYRYNVTTHRVEEVKSYFDCINNQECCGTFESRFCCPNQSYTHYAYGIPSSTAVIIGIVAGALMFVCFCACAIAKRIKPSQPALDPQTAQALRSITGGAIPRTPFQGLIVSSGADNAIQTSTPYTQTVRGSTTQTDDPYVAPPPVYEDCVRTNHILPPPVDKTISSFTNHTNTSVDDITKSDAEQSQHINSSDSTTCL